MITVGSPATRTLTDKWTVVTADGSLSAHFEHTVVVTREGAEILTLLAEDAEHARQMLPART
jgi:methionyl aminopeptidase